MAVQPLDSTPLAQKFVLKPEEAADLLGVSVRTIRYWVAERKIPYFQIASRWVVWFPLCRSVLLIMPLRRRVWLPPRGCELGW